MTKGESLLGKIFQNASLVFIAWLLVNIYFIASSYHTHRTSFKSQVLQQLESIAATLSLQLDGDAHAEMFRANPVKDAIKTNEQDSLYRNFHSLFKRLVKVNKLNKPVYTLVYEPENNHFVLGVNSSETPYFRHPYKDFPAKLLEYYYTGGQLEPYEDEHGHWLSAIAPIKDSNGKVVAILEVDQSYDEFLQSSNKAIIQNIILALILSAILAYFLFRTIAKILKKEIQIVKDLKSTKQLVDVKNRKITDSIQYAKRIQDSLLPAIDTIEQYFFTDAFVLFLPKDIVSGDFYWCAARNGKKYIAAVDCTGHGVPGAFMSVIGMTLLNDAIHHKCIEDPGEILDFLHSEVQRTLRQADVTTNASRDGMDLAICALDENNMTLEFAGAQRPLILIRNNKITVHKGNRKSIGGRDVMKNKDTDFKTIQLNVQKADRFYIYSDGYADQFGGLTGEKFKNKRLLNTIEKNVHEPMLNQKNQLLKMFNSWKGKRPQIDDVLVIGIQI